MRASLLLFAAPFLLAQDMAGAQDPWGTVKTWAGTATIEATETQKTDTSSLTLTYKATGDFTISDDALPDGDHVQWPMPNPEAMTDPAQFAAAYEAWQAHVKATYIAKGLDEMGSPFTVTCTADEKKAANVGVAIQPGTPDYLFSISAPAATFKCADPARGPGAGTRRWQQAPFQLTGQRGAPGPVSGTKTFTIDTTTIKVSYQMAPGR
jgi:hypothetical protein